MWVYVRPSEAVIGNSIMGKTVVAVGKKTIFKRNSWICPKTKRAMAAGAYIKVLLK